MATKKTIVKKAVTKKIAKKTVKKAVVKKVVKKPVSKEIVWSKVRVGTWFTATIESTRVIGKIQRQAGDIYLCQNKKDGLCAYNKLGFQHSWTIGSGSINMIRIRNVSNLKLLPTKPKSYKHIPIKRPAMVGSYELTYHEGYIMVGCTKVTNAAVRRIVKKLK
jgi:hypothetical protein